MVKSQQQLCYIQSQVRAYTYVAIDTVCIYLLYWKLMCIHMHMNYLVLNLEGNV